MRFDEEGALLGVARTDGVLDVYCFDEVGGHRHVEVGAYFHRTILLLAVFALRCARTPRGRVI